VRIRESPSTHWERLQSPSRDDSRDSLSFETPKASRDVVRIRRILTASRKFPISGDDESFAVVLASPCFVLAARRARAKLSLAAGAMRR